MTDQVQFIDSIFAVAARIKLRFPAILSAPIYVLRWDWKLKCFLACFLPLLSTYIVTYVSCQLALRSNKIGRKPPMAPYWTPFVGHLVSFVQNPAGLLLCIT